MPGDSVDRLFCILCLHATRHPRCRTAAYVPLHWAQSADRCQQSAGRGGVKNCAEMPQPGKLRGSLRFGVQNSPCRKFFGPWSAMN